ncbi:hypothetical protein [Microbacterium aurantiacum]|uniref:DUF2505 domain-containing protein n=1 Tax=Microbacterium aurantiacum TaxID=162393 RepID=A0ABT8FTS2_9MICO|nr:hypothetical protein [Microbacterium aurantiacum]MDN4464718.1 hypothetical protein [Microbacterium aurantiacum]
MALMNFSVVLVGENFPVQTIKIADFQYRHRALSETLRLPVALQAENNLVAMQVIPDRFEVRVKTADDLAVQTDGVSAMVDTFLEYVGKRTVTAVGHNAQWVLPGGPGSKKALASRFASLPNIEAIIGVPPSDVDLSFGFKLGQETRARASMTTSSEGEALLDFNFHFDISGPAAITTAIAELQTSLTHVRAIGEAMDRQNSMVNR